MNSKKRNSYKSENKTDESTIKTLLNRLKEVEDRIKTLEERQKMHRIDWSYQRFCWYHKKKVINYEKYSRNFDALWKHWSFADEYYFVCNELDNDLEITPFEQELTINTKKKFIEFSYITHIILEIKTIKASYGASDTDISSIVTFNKISLQFWSEFLQVQKS